MYHGVIPAERHTAMTEKARKPTHIERVNTTLRPRVARRVRAPWSFSKQGENHSGAITFCICHYNLEKAGALPV